MHEKWIAMGISSSCKQVYPVTFSQGRKRIGFLVSRIIAGGNDLKILHKRIGIEIHRREEKQIRRIGQTMVRKRGKISERVYTLRGSLRPFDNE